MPKHDIEIVLRLRNVTEYDDLGTLLRDALGEFVSARRPADIYVDERYPNMTKDWRKNKVLSVVRRNTVARALARAVDATGSMHAPSEASLPEAVDVDQVAWGIEHL
jgi:hypothetical protein